MFLLPKLEILQQTESVIRRFKGLNTHSVIDEAELADCANISTGELPALTVCNPWETIKAVAPSVNFDYVTCGQVMLEINKGVPWQITRHRLLADGTESTDTITLALGSEVLGMDEFSDELVLLIKKENQYFLEIYKNDSTVAQNVELNDLFTNDSPSIGGILTFCRRMLILQNGEIHISYVDDLTKWTEYLVNDQISPIAAQNISTKYDGDFVGAANFKNRPVLFKRGSMYELYNTYNPYDLSKVADVGCINPRSIVECSGVLYFLSEQGLMAYSSGMPKLVSRECPELAEAVGSSSACADSRHYYIGNYFYDTIEGVWGKIRSSSGVDSKCYFDGCVYYLWQSEADGVTTRYVSRYDPCRFDSELEPDEWYFVTKLFHEDSPNQKQLSKLYIRVEPQQAADIKVWISVDESDWKQLYAGYLTESGKQKILLRVPPCESCRFKIGGKGKVTVPYIKRIYRVIPDGKVHPFQ